MDDDVKEAAETVYTDADNLMRVINLTKKFKKFDAVRGLTFGVRKNECFGLLGVNGAGKTTTFRIELSRIFVVDLFSLQLREAVKKKTRYFMTSSQKVGR